MSWLMGWTPKPGDLVVVTRSVCDQRPYAPPLGTVAPVVYLTLNGGVRIAWPAVPRTPGTRTSSPPIRSGTWGLPQEDYRQPTPDELAAYSLSAGPGDEL